ncbi:MAG TPA: hypothetical protein VGE74_30550 [Gemmata sp.]
MTTRRFILAAIAFTLVLPLSGCGCRRNCNSSGSFAPPPCCPDRVPPPPPGFIPNPQP